MKTIYIYIHEKIFAKKFTKQYQHLKIKHEIIKWKTNKKIKPQFLKPNKIKNYRKIFIFKKFF